MEPLATASYEELSEEIDLTNEPWLEKPEFYEHPEKIPTEIQQIWAANGLVVIENLVPDEVLDAYMELRLKNPNITGFMSRGHASPCPYMQYKEIRDLSMHTSIMQVIECLIGSPGGLHLNLCNLKSTERDFHSDWHLNPPGINSHYIASWVACSDIDPDSGPFEAVPGSQRWPVITQKKVFEHLTPAERARPDWPAIAERFLTPAIEDKIKRSGLPVMSFPLKKGSVLFWNSKTIHRGSKPKNRELYRKALISHYSSVKVRSAIDMPRVEKWGEAHYFVHDHPLDPGNPAPTI